MPKQGQTGPNSAKQCQTVPNSVKQWCSDTPRFSYRTLKTAICTCPGGPASPPAATSRGAVWPSGYQGGYSRVGTRVGNTGVIPGTQPAARGEVQDSEAGPVGPCRGPEWVVMGLGRTDAAGRLLDHPPGPVRSLWDPPCPGPSECRLLAIGARIDLILLKVSQNRQVSPEYPEKACHSPYIQKRLQKSPLEILRF